MKIFSKSGTSSLLRRSLPFLWVLVAGVALVLFESVYLRRVEELNLFLSTPLFFRECLLVPGGMLSWAGAFLTQLFHVPLLGVAVLCLLWALLMLLMVAAFRLPARWWAVTLIPVSMLLISDVYLGYWIFYMKLRGYFFVATLGLMVAVVMALVYRVLPRYVRTVVTAVMVCCLYPVAGFYALLGALLIAVMSWRVADGKLMALADSVWALLVAVSVPLLCYRLVFHETHFDNIYWAGLPVFRMRQENYPLYNLPYVVMVLSLVLMAASTRRGGATTVTAAGAASSEAKGNKRVAGWLSATLMAVLALVVAVCWYKDGNFHRELRMSRCVSECDWAGVLDVARSSKTEPTRSMWMMKNLALTRQGRIGEEMYDYPNGAAKPRAPFDCRIAQTEGKALYFNYGLPNFCYRWCIENGVVYGWTVEELKFLTKCMLLNGEFTAAQKFISLLKKTLFHKKWAKRYEEYVHNPAAMTEDEELLPVVRLLTREDYIDSDNGQVERFLIEHLAGTESESPELQEQTLVAAMQMRNIDLFWLRFYQYVQLHQDEPVPTLYQQSACLFGGMDKKVDAAKMPFDKGVVESCSAFMEEFRGHRERGLPMEDIKRLMHDRFWRTYYYDYFFNTYQQEVY